MTWHIIKGAHEGFPILVRYDADRARDSRLPILATIELALAVCDAEGLPLKSYNAGLRALDTSTCSVFGSEGAVVLIETYQATRSYYFYVSHLADVTAALERLRAAYPEAKLTAESEADPAWDFFEEYQRSYLTARN